MSFKNRESLHSPRNLQLFPAVLADFKQRDTQVQVLLLIAVSVTLSLIYYHSSLKTIETSGIRLKTHFPRTIELAIKLHRPTDKFLQYVSKSTTESLIFPIEVEQEKLLAFLNANIAYYNSTVESLKLTQYRDIFDDSARKLLMAVHLLETAQSQGLQVNSLKQLQNLESLLVTRIVNQPDYQLKSIDQKLAQYYQLRDIAIIANHLQSESDIPLLKEITAQELGTFQSKTSHYEISKLQAAIVGLCVFFSGLFFVIFTLVVFRTEDTN